MAKGHPTPADIREKMVEMYLAGATYKQVQSALNIGEPTVRKTLRPHVAEARRLRIARITASLLARGVQVCTRCRRELPLTEFHSRPGKRSGRMSHCRRCCSEKAHRRTKVFSQPDCVRHNVTPAVLTAPQAAYLAALIDGEGSILLGIRNKTGRNYLSARMTITMTTPILCDIANEVGLGTVHYYTRPHPNNNIWMWVIGANACRALLPTILPYLRVKQRQGELLNEYLNLANRRVLRGQEYLETYNGRAMDIYRELRQMNRRGKRVEQSTLSFMSS